MPNFDKYRKDLKDRVFNTLIKRMTRRGVNKKTAAFIACIVIMLSSLFSNKIILSSIIEKLKSDGGTLPIPMEMVPQDIRKQEIVPAPKCKNDGVLCSYFEDYNWEGIEGFTIISGDVDIFQLRTDAKMEGNIMFFKEEIYPSFVAVLEVIPLSEEFNIVFQYGSYYRCIFGDGNNQTVGCQINNSWPHSSPSDWRYIDDNGDVLPKGGRWHFYMDKGVEGHTVLIIRFEQIPTKNSRDVKIKIRVTFFPASSSTSVERELGYTLTLKKLPSEIRDRIGVGLIDPKKIDKIQASFQYFEVDERPLD